MGDTNERRGAKRFPLELALEFDGGRGQTRDVSAHGVFFTTSRPLQAGDVLRCAVPIRGPSGQSQRLEFEAHVVRVEPQGGVSGVAAHLDAFESDLAGLLEPGAQLH